MIRQVGFEPPGKFTPGEHNASSAAFAFEANIRAQTGDGPFIGAAWMLFPEAEMVVETEVGQHGESVRQGL